MKKEQEQTMHVNDMQYSGAFEIALSESRDMFKAIFESASEGIVCFDAVTKKIILVNKEFCSMLGYEKNELFGLHVGDIHPKVSSLTLIDDIKKSSQTETDKREEISLMRKDKKIIYFEVTGLGLNISGHKLWVGFFKDISRYKDFDEKLKDCALTLENQQQLLEQKNIALTELAEQIERSKNKIEQDMVNNIESFITPIIKKIRLRGVSKKYVDLLQTHLAELTAPFSRKISQRTTRLSPRETEIAGMIKGGLSSKEISELINISYKTVNKHRRDIRKKMGLANKKINLTSFLQKI